MIKTVFKTFRQWAICASVTLITSAGAVEGAASTAQDRAGATPTSRARTIQQSPAAAVTEREIVRFRAEIEKLKIESEKLKEEQENLKMNNEALSRRSRTLIAWLSPLSSVVGVLIGALLGFFFNRNYSKAQGHKLEQEQAIEREKHMVTHCENLGSPVPGVQLAAAAMLVQRLEGMGSRNRLGDRQAALEYRTVVQVLVSITKKTPPDGKKKSASTGVNYALCKFISDSIRKTFRTADKAIENTRYQESPMAEFDFQGVQLRNSNWKGINADGADLFEADLCESSLRDASFINAVFMRTNLTKAKLQNSNLSGATLKDATLVEANLQSANFGRVDEIGLGANDPAKSIDPKKSETKFCNLRGADLTGALLIAAKFDEARVFGAKIANCKFDESTTGTVDISAEGDGKSLIPVLDWLTGSHVACT